MTTGQKLFAIKTKGHKKLLLNMLVPIQYISIVFAKLKLQADLLALTLAFNNQENATDLRCCFHLEVKK